MGIKGERVANQGHWLVEVVNHTYYNEVILKNEATGAYFAFAPQIGCAWTRLELPFTNIGVQPVIAPLAPDADLQALHRFTARYQNALLWPWPNRLADACYSLDSTEHYLPMNEPNRGNALHGLASQMNFELAQAHCSDDGAEALLMGVFPGAQGYPWPWVIQLVFQLSEKGLAVSTACQWLVNGDVVTLDASQPESVPIGWGWHPYIKLGDYGVDSLLLELPAADRLELDNRLLPTEELFEYSDFSTLKQLGNTVFDTPLWLDDTIPLPSTSLLTPAGWGIEIWQQNSNGQYAFLQLFTPPERDSIAVEPATCAPNAFHNGMGLQWAEAGQWLHASFGIRPVLRSQ